MESGMRTNTFILILSVLLISKVSAQNITNTLGTSGQFSIKDGSTTYLSLGQSNGNLSLNRSMTLLNTTGSNMGVIYKGTDRFIHNYQSPSSFGENTFVGINSGNFIMSGSAGESSYNTGIGMYSLYTNSTGYNNTALGHASLTYNNIGYQNTAIGTSSLASNSSGINNTAVGFRTLLSNTIGSQNTAIGTFALISNINGSNNIGLGYYALRFNDGNQNVAIGHQSLYSNRVGGYNVAIGTNSLINNWDGNANTSVGLYALNSNVSGSSNSAFGSFSGKNISTGNNNISIGFDSEVPLGSESNQVRIGNTYITYAGIQVAWTITSDRRWKQNIQASNLGLGFVTKLRPVTYTRINDEEQKTEYGLIAQDIENVLKEEGIENTGMLTIDEKGMYELRYNDLIAPMIKSIQELKSENDMLKAEIESLKTAEDRRLAKLEQMIMELQLKDIRLTEK
jgi:trimeric autotransporter adhesin